jgi:hypothetical protein
MRLISHTQIKIRVPGRNEWFVAEIIKATKRRRFLIVAVPDGLPCPGGQFAVHPKHGPIAILNASHHISNFIMRECITGDLYQVEWLPMPAAEARAKTIKQKDRLRRFHRRGIVALPPPEEKSPSHARSTQEGTG